MNKVELSAELVQLLVNYLQDRPFRDVHELLPRLLGEANASSKTEHPSGDILGEQQSGDGGSVEVRE